MTDQELWYVKHRWVIGIASIVLVTINSAVISVILIVNGQAPWAMWFVIVTGVFQVRIIGHVFKAGMAVEKSKHFPKPTVEPVDWEQVETS
jgi:hypothetical protein